MIKTLYYSPYIYDTMPILIILSTTVLSDNVCVYTLESGCSCVVVDKVLDSLLSVPHLPAQGEGQLLGHRQTWVLPLRRLALVVDKIHPLVGQHPLLWGGRRERERERERERCLICVIMYLLSLSLTPAISKRSQSIISSRCGRILPGIQEPLLQLLVPLLHHHHNNNNNHS